MDPQTKAWFGGLKDFLDALDCGGVPDLEPAAPLPSHPPQSATVCSCRRPTHVRTHTGKRKSQIYKRTGARRDWAGLSEGRFGGPKNRHFPLKREKNQSREYPFGPTPIHLLKPHESTKMASDFRANSRVLHNYLRHKNSWDEFFPTPPCTWVGVHPPGLLKNLWQKYLGDFYFKRKQRNSVRARNNAS